MQAELINRQTAVSQVAEALRLKILRGELPGGRYVRQEAIAQRLGVSRLPVREALMLLERAFEQLDAGVLARAEAIIDRSRQARSIEEWAELNWQFHKTLYEPANLDLTLKTLEQVIVRADRYFRLQRTLSAKLKDSNDEQHRRVIALLREGQRAQAVAAMADHIAWNREDMGETVEFLKSVAPATAP